MVKWEVFSLDMNKKACCLSYYWQSSNNHKELQSRGKLTHMGGKRQEKSSNTVKGLITPYVKPTSSELFVMQHNIFPYCLGQLTPFLWVLQPRTSWHFCFNRGSTPNNDSHFELSTLLAYAHQSLTRNYPRDTAPDLASWTEVTLLEKTETLLLLAVSQNLTIQVTDIIEEEWK